MAQRMAILDAGEEGRRLRRLRLLAQVSLETLASNLGYGKGGNSSLSMIERAKDGRRLSDHQRRMACNFLAGKGELVNDAIILHAYVMGDHDSLDSCLGFGGDGGLAPTEVNDNVAPIQPSSGYRPFLSDSVAA